jgi:hypothetical protein
VFNVDQLTLNLLTATIVAPPSNASKWQMGFNSAFKELRDNLYRITLIKIMLLTRYVISFTHIWVLGMFTKLRKAIINFVITVYLSVCPHGNYTAVRIFVKTDYFFNSVEIIQVSLKSNKNNCYFIQRPIHIFDYMSLNPF